MKTELAFLGQCISIASRARRRRLLVLIYVGLAALLIAWLWFYGSPAFSVPALVAYLLIARFLGGRSYRSGLVPAFESGDERERHRRDHAYYAAYKWWDLALISAFLATGLKNVPLSPEWNPALHTFFDRLSYGLLIGAGILYYTLPQAILLWTEPDMEEFSE
jgi:hypothetical protein